MNKIFKDNITRNFIFISVIIFVAIFIIEKINGRFWLNDFKVFYLAAKALVDNEQVYGVAFGLPTGFYKYSPFTLLFFVPSTYISFEAASIIDFFIIASCAIATIILLDQILSKYVLAYRKSNFLILLSILFCVIIHLVRELHLGNTNIIVLLLLSLSLKFTLESRPIRSGILLAIVLLTKPYFIICLLPFLLYKKQKTLLSVGAALILFILSSCLITGVSKSIVLYSQWFSAMKEHSDYLTSHHTIFSILDHYFGISIPVSYSIFLTGAIGILFLGYFLFIDRRESVKSNVSYNPDRSLVLYFFLLISILPNLLITDTEHFLFSLPLIAILIFQLTKVKSYLWGILFILLILMYGGNSSDLFGKYLAGKFEDLGLLGLSNLIIISCVFYLYSGNKFNLNSDL